MDISYLFTFYQPIFSLFQERKRQKRAEMNKKLGVKKLKLPISMPKPKPVPVCKYYLHGRCQQVSFWVLFPLSGVG